jgi:hypothetical protein
MEAVSAELLRVDYERSMTKALAGRLLFGELGMLAGLKAKKKATFRVTYATGHTGTEIVKVESLRYRKLISLVE